MRLRQRLCPYCVAVFLIGTAAASAPAARAQVKDPIEVSVFHGEPARIFRLVDATGAYSPRAGAWIRLVRPVGSSVCVVVPNSNPVLFDYGVNATVDSSRAALPEAFQTLATALTGLLGTGVPTGAGAAPALLAPSDAVVPPLDNFLSVVRTLAADADSIRIAAAAAAAPGELHEATGQIVGDGLTAMKAAINRIPAVEGRIRYPNIEAQVDNLHRAALNALNDQKNQLLARDSRIAQDVSTQMTALPGRTRANEQAVSAAAAAIDAAATAQARQIQAEQTLVQTWEFVLGVLAGYAKQQIGLTRKTIDTYVAAKSGFRDCRTVRDGENSFTVNIAAKEEFARNARSTGDSLVTIRIGALYERHRLEMFPAAFVLHKDKTNTYTIRNDVIELATEEESRLEPRLGAVAAVTLYDRFDDLRDVAFSVGAGTNIIGGEDPVEDLFVLGFVSYRDLFRFGAGAGRAQTMQLRRGHSVGVAVPAGTTVPSILEKRPEWGFVMMFSIAGLKLGAL